MPPTRARTPLAAALAVLSTTVAAPAPAAASPATARPAAPATAPATAPAAGRPGAALRTVALGPLPGGAAGVTRARTARFSLLGVTWADPHARAEVTVTARVRAADGAWGRWRLLDTGRPVAEGPASRGGTDPLWVGPAHGVQVRVTPARPGAALPGGLRLDLVDPDAAGPAPGAAAPARPSGAPAPARPTGRFAAPHAAGDAAGAAGDAAGAAGRAAAGAPVVPRPTPRLVGRAAWGADESLVAAAPSYSADVRVVFVHHTATGNGYSCADTPRILRGIQAYHVRSKRWNDIGYNFLVDRCGRLYEGRAGGAARPVLGAHTLGFNAHSTAVAVVGDHGARGASAPVRAVIAQVAAWKLGAYGHDPAGRTVLTSGGSDRYPAGRPAALYRVSAHRDTGRTECPGDALYAQLGGIRAVAGAAPYRFALARVAGAAAAGGGWYTRGPLVLTWRTGTPSALLHRFDVLVDGRVAAATGGAYRTARLSLPPGPHTVQVRAVHLNGRSAATAVLRVLSDATAPRFTRGPSVTLRTGTLDGTVPVALGWSVADPGGLRAVALTLPRAVALRAGATRWNGAARPGLPGTYALRAVDRSGNAAAAAVSATPVVTAESAGVRGGAWTALRGRSFLGGTAVQATAAGTTLTWTVRGTAVALAATRTPRSGRVRITVDGRPAGTADLRAATTVHRRAVWAGYLGGGTHTVRVTVEGTPGRPAAALDGLVVLR